MNGYHTVGAGKWHIGYYNDAHLPENRGLDDWLGYLGGAEDYFFHNLTSRPCKVGVSDFWEGNKGPAQKSDYFPQYSPFIFSNYLEDHIRGHDTEEPLFVYFAMQSVHGPTQAPKRFWDLYKKEADAAGCAWDDTQNGHKGFSCTPKPGFEDYQVSSLIVCNLCFYFPKYKNY